MEFASHRVGGVARSRSSRTRRRTGRATEAVAVGPLSSASHDYRFDIQGLRAVAIVSVVLFHAGLPGLGGGFVGVDVFFVISGFLITGLLSREVSATGSVRLGAFYGARARRLLPAGCLVLVVTAIASAALLAPLPARSALGDVVASALYVGNYRFASAGTDYLAAAVPRSPVQQYWSLGVEEQFYLFWPALIIGAAWLMRRRTRQSAAQAPQLLVMAFVAVASFALSVNMTSTSPPWAFFSLATRAWELAAGGLVALTAALWRRLPIVAASISSGVGMTMIVLACALLDDGTPYPGTAALVPVLGTALVIGSGCAPAPSGVKLLLSLPAMQALGRLSYSWYLWHWPVLLLAPRVLGHPLSLAERLMSAMLSAVLAAATLALVEDPIRLAAPLRRSATRSLVLGAALTATAVSAALVLLILKPVPTAQGAPARAVAVSVPGVQAPVAAAADGDDSAVQQAIGQVQASVADSVGLQQVPSNLSPPLATASADKPEVFVNGCVRSWQDVGQSECATGDPASPTTVALVGDSHAAMWNPAVEELAVQRHWRLETLAKVTCPLQDLPITSPYLGREYTECEQWRNEVLTRVRDERPRLVVLSMSRRYGADFGFTSYDPAWITSLSRLVADLSAIGTKVVVLGPIPDPRADVPACLSEHIDDATACEQPRGVAVNDAGISTEAAATAAAGGRYDDITQLFCTAARCPMIVGNNLVYRDDNHITIEYAKTLTPVIAALIDRAIDH